MASAPPDYFGMIRAPSDFQLNRARVDLAQAQRDEVISQARERQAEAARLAAYQQAQTATRGAPTPDNIASLMIQFPEQSEALRRAYQTQSEGMQRRNTEAAASVWALLQRGDTERALTLLRQRREALVGAGESTEVTDSIISSIESGDPARLRDAQFITGMVLAAADPDQVGQTLNSLGDATRRRLREVDGVFFDEQTGEPIVQSPYARIIAGPDGSFYEVPRVPTIPVLGGQSAGQGTATTSQPSSGGEAAWSVISRPGAPRDGGARTHQGYDITPPQGRPEWRPNQPFRIVNPRNGERQGYTADVILEDGTRIVAMHLRELPRPGSYNAGDIAVIAGNTGNARNTPTHIHAEAYRGGQRVDPSSYFTGERPEPSGLPRITTRQAYERLRSGDRYLAPDGTVRTKS